jgi:hypothetical protein
MPTVTQSNLENINSSNGEKGSHCTYTKANKPVSDSSSYQPVSSTSTLTKTMEKMVSSRLTLYLETQQLLSPTEAGFRRQCSTNQQIVMLSQKINDSLRQKGTNSCGL